MRTHTNANDLLRRKWFCETCGREHEGANAPDECSGCGGGLFENGLDIVGEGRPLPVVVPNLGVRARTPSQVLLGVPRRVTPRPTV